ncbi:TPA: hypothetical protein DCZ81_04050 [Candidatus Collierbacteria bacterium]|nr:MAG: hypothetical protein UW48_C0009G0022 [Microgenomates group bacterium GW2011_GWC1_44_23]KKT95251.1 MAG: hypothetical protein UW96_C0009G0022 [Candidatus Collierbacteria bacterium GW2011_GWA1_45_15]HBC45313.1 hypothetical protein [Candidatus Collierbacteria bacterium]
MDIGSGRGFPSANLSNFHPHPFVIDGVECSSMEGFLQSLKFDKPHIQVEVCKLVGLAAKFKGKKRNKAWKSRQKLWWQGKEFDRHGEEFQLLLDRAFDALSQNTNFQKALLETGKSSLSHSIGSSDPHNTVLTVREFCGRLEKIRNRLQKKD